RWLLKGVNDIVRSPFPRAGAWRRRGRARFASSPGLRELDLIALDDGVGEIEIDDLPLAHLVDAAEAQRAQRMRDRLALRVEHALLQHHMHARLHHCTVFGPLTS